MTDVNFLSLPTNPDRAAVFARARGGTPVFDERLSVWIVLDPRLVSSLLQDARLDVPDIGAALSTLEARYGISLPNVRWAATVLPLVTNGEAHRKVRQPLAKMLSADRRRVRAWPQGVAALVADALASAGKLDAVARLLAPSVDLIFRDITGIAVDFPPLTLTKIFDRYASYRQVISLEGHIADLRARIATRDTPPEGEGTVASLVVLGRDSLLSSLAESFANFMMDCRGRRLDDDNLPPAKLFSGVAVSERVATEPFELAGATFKAGDRIRMYFQGYHAVDNDTERLAFFGSGGHSCLGRSLALEVWSLMVSEIVKMPRTVIDVQAEYIPSVIIAMPKYVNVELA